MNQSTENSLRFAARQAGGYYSLRNCRTVFRFLIRAAWITFFFGTTLAEVLYYALHPKGHH